jgi:hypothetical protein
MKILGFNFTKINAIKYPDFESSGIKYNVEFTDVSKDKIEVLNASDIVKISFKFMIDYEKKKNETDKEKESKNSAEIIFEGVIILSAEKEEIKEILKSWKKKEIPALAKATLFNIILKKCSIKALSLHEDLNLPTHIPFPQIKLQPKKE